MAQSSEIKLLKRFDQDVEITGTITTGGNINIGDGTTDDRLKVYFTDTGSSTEVTGFGMVFNRGTSYLRPSSDGTHTLYIGGSDATLDWSIIAAKYSGAFILDKNGTEVLRVDSNTRLLSGNLQIGSTTVIDSSRNITAVQGNFSGTVKIDTGANSGDALVLEGDAPTINFIDTGSNDDFYIHVNSNNFYVLTNRDSDGSVGTGWEGPHPLQLEADTNTGYVFGNTIIHGGNISSYALTSLPSHTHDDRYYTISDIQSFFNRGYLNSESANNLPVGWYTIATNTGDRALGEFQIWDLASSDHQSVLFNASHHFGNDSSNDITVLANSRYSGTNFRYIRIKDNGTYDGAALQVYVDGATNAVYAAIVGGNAQSSGWVLKDWIPDATDPGDLSGYSNFGVRCQVDLDLVLNGGIITTGEIYSGGATSQFRVLNTGDNIDADTVDGLQASQFLRSDTSDTMSGDLTINPSTNYALYIGRMAGQPNIKSSDSYAFMDSNGGHAGLNWYTSDNVTLANGGGSVAIGNSSITQKLTVHGTVGATIYYDRDNTNYYVNPAGTSRLGFGIFDGYDGASGNNSRLSTGVSIGRYTSEYAYIEIASSNAGGGWIDFNQADGTDYLGRIRYHNGSNYMRFWAGGNEEFNIYSSYTLALGSSRAPIFYDSNNTAYYVDPATTGISFYTQGRISQINQSNSTWPYLFVTSSVGNDNHSGFWVGSNGYPDMRLRRENSTVRALISSWERSFTTFGFTDSTDMRAPIFYDNNNTGYYTDPASTSNLNNLTVNGTLYAAGANQLDYNFVRVHENQNYVASSTSTSNRGNFGKGITVYEGYSGGTNRPHTYDATLQVMPTTNQGFELSVDWVSQTKTPLKIRSLRDCCNGWSEWREVLTAEHTNSGNFLTSGSMRADRFYDVNDTTFYIEPNGTSVVNAVKFFGAFYHDTNNRNEGMFGSYDSTKTDHIWSMGTAYRNASDGSNFGNLYGLAYKHTNNTTGGTMGGGHQMVWCNNGTPRGAIGYDRVWHVGDMQAGGNMFANNFYDDDNTSFYINPAGISNINELHGSGKEIFDATDDSYLRINQSASFSSGCWFGNSQILQGSDRFIAAGGNGGTTSSRVYIYGGTYTGTNVIKIDGNSGIIQTTTDSMRAPVFYDYNNTARYVDPSSTSVLSAADFKGTVALSYNELRLAGLSDGNHYLKKISTGYSTATIDGPQLQGHQGGELTTNYTGNNWALRWAIGGVVYVNSTFHAGGDILAYSSSDKQLKDNIKPIENPIDKVQKISGVEFDWNEKQDTYEHGKHDVGVIAQEIEEVLPDIVTTRDNGYKAVKYEKIVPLLIEAIKEQQKQIDELKKLINP